jgi:hypothetical protein
MRAHGVLLLVCLFAIAAFAVPASAVVVEKNLAQLGQEAQSIIIGRVVSMESRLDSDDGLIYTYVTVRVREHIKGKPTTSDVVIRVPGGEVADMGLAVSDAPWFEPGDDVLVFLAPELKGAHSVVGWYQGKLTIKDGKVEEFGLPLGEVLSYIKGGVPNRAKPARGCYKLCGYTWEVNGSYSNGKWGPGNQGWSINNNNGDGITDAQVATALRAATAAWDAAGACWAFGGNAGNVTHNNITGPVQNYVNMCTFGSTGGSVATTYTWYMRKGKATVEVDLVFDDGWRWQYEACGSTNSFDLQNVATHEFGHWLCVGDLYGAADAEKTMYGYVDYGWCQQRTLHQCDIDAAIAIYGACAAAMPLASAGDVQPGRASLGEISYSVPEEGPVAVRIFDITGRLVKVLVNENQPAGAYTLRWDGSTQAGNRVAAGVYFYRVETRNATWSDKLILVK